jgi:hypothetical protein
VNRRIFIAAVVGAAAGLAILPRVFAATVTTPVAVDPADQLEADNMFAWCEAIRACVRDGHEFEWASLEREQNGYRLATLYLREGSKISWPQPWSEERHAQANVHYNFMDCERCGVRSLRPHLGWCRNSTPLAYRRYLEEKT